MQPIRVTISFLGHPWSQLDLELAQTEVNLDDAQTIPVEDGLSQLFDSLGFNPLADGAVLNPRYRSPRRSTPSPAPPPTGRTTSWTSNSCGRTHWTSSCSRSPASAHSSTETNTPGPHCPLRDIAADRDRHSVAAAEARLGAPDSPVRADLDEAITGIQPVMHTVAVPNSLFVPTPAAPVGPNSTSRYSAPADTDPPGSAPGLHLTPSRRLPGQRSSRTPSASLRRAPGRASSRGSRMPRACRTRSFRTCRRSCSGPTLFFRTPDVAGPRGPAGRCCHEHREREGAEAGR